MKAKVKETGEIIDVEAFGMDGLMYVIFKETSSTSARTFKQYQLDFDYNNPPTDKNIDWEQRRFELVKAAMQGILTNPITKTITNNIIDMAISTADAVIAKLK